MKWFCIALACIGLVGELINCTPVSPIPESSHSKNEDHQTNIPNPFDVMLTIAHSFTGALQTAFKGEDKQVNAYTKEVVDRASVDSLKSHKDSLFKQVDAHTKQIQDVAAKLPIGSIPPVPKPADLTPNLADLKPNLADLKPNAADLTPNLADLKPNLADLEPKLDDVLPKQTEDAIPKAEATYTRKRRSASPIDTKVDGRPRIEDRYNIEAASMESFSGKFLEQPKGLQTTCPKHDGGPVIIMIQSVKNLSLIPDSSEGSEGSD